MFSVFGCVDMFSVEIGVQTLQFLLKVNFVRFYKKYTVDGHHICSQWALKAGIFVGLR